MKNEQFVFDEQDRAQIMRLLTKSRKMKTEKEKERFATYVDGYADAFATVLTMCLDAANGKRV